ncbi:hypothetical protein AAMO2058_001720100 [Amorphochlora amoebiformis]
MANNCIRRFAYNEVTTIAGSPHAAGILDGSANHARFRSPTSATVCPDGSIYVVDSGNAVIRKISLGNLSTSQFGPLKAPQTALDDLRLESLENPEEALSEALRDLASKRLVSGTNIT